MVASHDTIARMAMVILKHLKQADAQALIRDLEEIPGNKSFRDTIHLLSEAVDHIEMLPKEDK